MSDTMSMETGVHLAVLIHGLWGNPSHLAYLEKSLNKAYPGGQLQVLVVKSNASNLTYDGIELGGERVTHEVEGRIKELEDNGSKVTKMSVIGYSFGGLLARYAIGLLYANGWFDRIQPVNFTTFATPHLGVRTPLLGTKGYIWNVLGASTLGLSGRQMFLIDSFRDTGRPLLSILADPNSIFIRGLSLFKNRSLYANVINDRSVVFYTGCMSRNDPFVDMSTVTTHPLPDTESVILDPEHPLSPKVLAPMSLFGRIAHTTTSTLKSLPFFLLLCIALPIGSAVFLTNAGIQSFRSARRVALHESGQAGIGIERYRRMPPLIQEAKHAAERTFRTLGPGRMEEDFLVVGDGEVDGVRTPGSSTDLLSSESSTAVGKDGEGLVKVDGESDSLAGDGAEEGKERKRLPGQFKGSESFPTLALTKEQFEMIENMEDVGITKYLVHITSVRHTHAAIVVRSRRPGFGQGKIVVKHWVENFEL